jgi:uncharacterized cupin superfamily protein
VTEIVNLLEAPLGEERAECEGFHHFDLTLGPLLGAELLGCALYTIPPGARNWPYHFHRGNEEWAVVVAGTPTLRTPEGERTLAVGDIVAFPLDEPGAHDLSNRSAEDVRVAIFSTLRPSTYPVYPDSDKVGANRKYFRMRDAVDYWDGEGPA